MRVHTLLALLTALAGTACSTSTLQPASSPIAREEIEQPEVDEEQQADGTAARSSATTALDASAPVGQTEMTFTEAAPPPPPAAPRPKKAMTPPATSKKQQLFALPR